MIDIEIPADFPVQPIDPNDPTAKAVATCGTCGLSWDDGEVTSMTPTPSGRCPFEAFHEDDEGDGDSEPESVWEYTENAPDYVEATADLWHWSTNYQAGQGPITLFLDLIGWSDEQIGEPLYNMRDAKLGYVELSKLAAALTEYANRPHDVRDWIDGLLAYDEA